MTVRESAVVLCIPEAEELVDRWRHRYDTAAQHGVPAHITLLYPFVPPDSLTADVDRSLQKLLGRVAPFEIVFSRAGRFGEQVLFLDPEPAEPLVEMIRALSGHFGIAPYQGTIPLDEVRPHLTVVDGHPGVMDEVEAALRPALPISCHVSEAWIITSDDTWRWSKLRRVAIGVA